MKELTGIAHRFVFALLVMGGLGPCFSGVACAQASAAQPQPAETPILHLGESASRDTRVFRGGRPVELRPGMPLQNGDEVQTGGEVDAVVIDFPTRGRVALAARTRVRIGSLEVLFGRVFANVRGLFSVSSANVVAGVEGTSFMVDVGLQGQMRVVVLEGVVVCRSRSDTWAPMRVRAGELFSGPVSRFGVPGVGRANPSEIRAAQALGRSVL